MPAAPPSSLPLPAPLRSPERSRPFWKVLSRARIRPLLSRRRPAPEAAAWRAARPITARGGKSGEPVSAARPASYRQGGHVARAAGTHWWSRVAMATGPTRRGLARPSGAQRGLAGRGGAGGSPAAPAPCGRAGWCRGTAAAAGGCRWLTRLPWCWGAAPRRG